MTGSLREMKGKYYMILKFKDEEGSWKQTSKPTGLEVRGNKKNAQKMLSKYLEKNSDKHMHKRNEILFVDYLVKWLESKQGNIENNTFLEYKRLIQKHIEPYFKYKKLSLRDIKSRHIADFYEFKSKNGRLDGNAGGVSPRVLKYFSTIFCQAFKKAIIDQIIENHPSINVPIPKLEKKVNIGKFLEANEAQCVINAFEGHILKPIVIIAIYYGMRRSEILGLKWDAINFEKNVIEVKHTVVCHSEGIEKRDRTKTSSSRRTLSLISEIKNLLMGMKTEQDKNRAVFGKAYENSDYVFTWQDGKLMRPDYITAAFKKVLKRNKIPTMRFHDLRHACSSLLYERGFELKDIQKWLGHSDIRTTSEIYTHISNRHMEALASGLAGSFKLSAG